MDELDHRMAHIERITIGWRRGLAMLREQNRIEWRVRRLAMDARVKRGIRLRMRALIGRLSDANGRPQLLEVVKKAAKVQELRAGGRSRGSCSGGHCRTSRRCCGTGRRRWCWNHGRSWCRTHRHSRSRDACQRVHGRREGIQGCVIPERAIALEL